MSDNSVIVVGAGVLGVSVATHLTRIGAQVTLITEKELCSGASSRSLSWLNSAAQRSAPYHYLRMAGIDRYRTLACSHPNLDWLRFEGGIRWEGSEAELADCQRYELNRGYESHLINKQQVASVSPDLIPSTADQHVIHNPGEGWVSLPHLIDHLMVEFKANGGTLIEHAGYCSVITNEQGEATGVESPKKGVLSANKVVLCCGPKSTQMTDKLGVSIPDDSPLSMLVTVEPVDIDIPQVLNTPRVAIRPNPGHSYVMDHSWYEESITELPNEEYEVDSSVIDELVDEARLLMKDGQKLKVAKSKAGRKPVPGDGQPVVGRLDKVPGCFIAFTHSGATLALILGELLADEVLNGTRNPMLETFRPERFA